MNHLLILCSICSISGLQLTAGFVGVCCEIDAVVGTPVEKKNRVRRQSKAEKRAHILKPQR